jgi:nucleoside-diphosphate-sugar epimerase
LTIFITGSTGIIGRQLLKELELGYPNSKIYKLSRHKKNFISNCIQIDLLNTNSKEIDLIIKKYKPSLFFHLAWCTNHSDYLVSDENIKWEQITKNLINSFYNAGGKKFIGIGSSIEYNWKKTSPFHEINSELNGNDWLYGKTKINIFNYLSKFKNICYQWHRIFFVYGPGQSENRLVPLIINNAYNRANSLSINLNLQRDYLSTFEIAKQICMMSKTSYSGSLNICSGKSIFLGKLISKIERLTNKKVSLSKKQFSEKFDIQDISGSQDIIKKFYPNYFYSDLQFDEDLTKTIKYYI